MALQIGSKGLEIKVDNPESYNFRPKDMLREICTTISQFSTQPGFHKVRGAYTFGCCQASCLSRFPRSGGRFRRMLATFPRLRVA